MKIIILRDPQALYEGFFEPRNESTINQIDLTSTLSLLLDVPIPFGSLGTPITELFHTASDQQEYSILSKAYQQSVKYLHAYGNANFISMFEISDKDWNSAQSLRDYLERVRTVLREVLFH